MDTKKCTTCWIEKELNCYWKHKISKDWFRNICRDCRKIETKKYRVKYKDKEKLRHSIYYNNNTTCILLQNNNWKNLNKESIKRQNKSYRDSHKEEARIYKHNRRLREWSTNDWTITIKSLEELLFLQYNKCALCGLDISNREDRHMDHIYPLSRWWNHSIHNIQWLCIKCNLSKWNTIT